MAGWAPALALLATTLSCRGVYGYILLAIGLATASSTRWLRSRAILVVLACRPLPLHGDPGFGLLGRRDARPGGRAHGTGDTVHVAAHAEDEVIQWVLGRDPIFGFGNYIWNGESSAGPTETGSTPSGWAGSWGCPLQLLALSSSCPDLALSRPPAGPTAGRRRPRVGLAAWCILQMIDGLHNNSYFTPTALVGGTLVGAYLSRDAGRVRGPADRSTFRPG